ncbi:MAG TPA: hypothetical protein PL077_01360 [Treponemataceae bacterium]|nr:hypothetical protein [Treponemataceae bacterium]
MKKLFLIVLSLIISTVIYCEKNQFLGNWKEIPTNTKSTLATFHIYEENDLLLVKFNKNFITLGNYENSSNTVFFVFSGYGPTGPLEKIYLRENELHHSALINGEWKEIKMYKKDE